MSSAAAHSKIIVVGGGVFGLTGAVSLRARGHEVTLLDPGPIPAPNAASTDISKVVRMEYGDDEFYMELMERAIAGWAEWNRASGKELYRETGVLMMSEAAMASGGFEHDSYQSLRRRGHKPTAMAETERNQRFPAWESSVLQDGFFHDRGGFAPSSQVVEWLRDLARARGVEVVEGAEFAEWTESGSKVTGVVCKDGRRLEADIVVLASGAWIATHHPELAGCFRPLGQPIYHLKPTKPELFEASVFPVFTADVSKTGWYGFPLSGEGIVKVANHGPGRVVDPDSDRTLTPDEEARIGVFLERYLPALAGAEVNRTRLCLYSDSCDGDFWIARDPVREGLVVASGGSGHGFKFAPVLGDLIADAVEGTENRFLSRFRWRPEVKPAQGVEAARWDGRE